MPVLYIDNVPYEVEPGKNLLETCLNLGFDLPYFCWHPAMGAVGACRQCAIKVFRDENDPTGKLVMSCMEPVAENQRISMHHPDAEQFRKNVIEWLMTNHPHDCAVCDEGGSCHLQDMTVMTGHAYRRFNYNKRTHRNQELGPFINHEMNRCIQCYRCVRFYKDYAGGKDLDVFASKANVYFGRAEDGTLESEFSGNLAEVCPTGVFTDKTLKKHYTRKWDLIMAPSVCHHCSLGCNIIAGERYGKLRMVANRYNGEVNGYFLCDRGRFGYEYANAPDRIRQPVIDKQTADAATAIREVAAAIRNGKAIGIGSPRASLQSNFALKSLVGEDLFFHGVSDPEHDMGELAIHILKDGPSRTFSLREVETADAVFILGEDLTNTAPMLALAVRQASRRAPIRNAQRANIPGWHDAAVREYIQDEKGPLFIAAVKDTKLDELATEVYRAAPEDQSRLGYAVAHLIDNALEAVPRLPPGVQALAEQIAQTLLSAERPVIISGTSCESKSVIKAAANVAWALQKKNPKAGIVLTLAECNSLGLAMMGGHRLDSAFNAVINGHADTAIIMENDLYRHGKTDEVDRFLSACKRVVVFDHTPTATTSKADVILSAGTFAESDGILINNEGRAQCFFQVFEPDPNIKESWRWLLDIGRAAHHEVLSRWSNFRDITVAIAHHEPLLADVDKAAPPPEFRIAGQRIPRAPHRYSGRTAALAHINVSEPKPPEDTDSPLSYTMEGFRWYPPSSMIPFFWSPGWNSVQSVAKYQEKVAGALNGGDPGRRMFEPNASGVTPYFTVIPDMFNPMKDHLWTVPLHHIYGSEELSARGEAVSQRVPRSYVMINHADAAKLGLKENQETEFEIEKQKYRLPVLISQTLPEGMAGLPYGLPGLPFVELPAWLVLKTS